MIQKFKNKLNKDANLKELLSGSAVTFIIKITGMLIGYVVVLMISRKYGAEGTGIYTLTSSFLNSLAIFGALGFNVAVLRYVGEFNKQEDFGKLKLLYKYMVQMAFPFTVLVGVLIYFFAREIAENIFDNTTYIPALKVGAIALPFFTINLIQVEFIRGLKQLKISEYLRSINRPLVVIILLLFAVFNFGVLDAVYAFVVGLLLSFLISSVFIYNFFRNKKNKQETTEFGRKELISTSFPMMTTSVASFILANAGAFFLEIYSTTDQVGVFNVCLRLAQLVSLVLVVVNTISAPKFAELYWGDNMIELKKVVRQSTKIIFYSSLIISLGLILFSRFILELFGSDFTMGIWTLIFLIAGQLVNAMTGSVSIFLNMTGNQTTLRNIILGTTSIVLIAYTVFIPTYGMEGAAIVFTLGMLFLNTTAAYFIYKKSKIITFYIPFKIRGTE